MKKLAAVLFALVTATGFAAVPLTQASAQSREQEVVDRSTEVIEHLHRGHEETAVKARELLHHARAVLIIPSLKKGGFIFGAQGGSGVLVARQGANDWSQPAFYGMGAGSFGLQIGFEVSRVVLIIMNDHALNALMENKVKLGAEAGLAIATIGGGAEASTTTHGGADIYVIAESKGLFGGVAVQGGIVGPQHDRDAAYYGHRATTRDIIMRRNTSNPGANALQTAMDGI
ncbi:MAG TPA: lipid-binding SYLF domain-containing protein [Magnetospirillaceae bacterium]|jgi:lipid-binding SYLF domain-containing protein